jgi:hypothetical protein
MSGADWRTLPRESNWIYRVRVFRGSPTDSGEIWHTRLYVRRSGAEYMRDKYEARGYHVTVEVSAFAPVFVPVAELDACSSPTRRRLPVVEGVSSAVTVVGS